MLNTIVIKLNTDYPNVKAVRFGDRRPRPPYCVVKRETGTAGQNFRIIAHFLPGQQVFLDTYIRSTVGTILDYKVLTSIDGNVNKITPIDFPAEVTTSNDDGTISCERTYSMPDMVF